MARPLAALVLAVMLAAGCELEEDEGVAPEQTTTTASEAAAAAVVQEIYADLTEQDCAEEVLGFHDYALVMADTVTSMGAALDAGLLLDAELDYWQLWGQTTIALDEYALWMKVCAPKSSPQLVAEVESMTPTVSGVWDALEASCLEELQAHGWTCTPA